MDLLQMDLLQQSLWPEVRHIATRREYWYQQNGAEPYAIALMIAWISCTERFQTARLISRRTEHAWPAHSPWPQPIGLLVLGWISKPKTK